MPEPVPNPRFLLLYAPLQFAPEEQAKPDGSLSLPYLAGALRRAGYDVRMLDLAVGTNEDSLDAGFCNTRELASGLIRVGLSEERIAREIEEADVIGVSSIFTPQTSMALSLIALIKRIAPHKRVIAGGVNARSLRQRFFRAGTDVIFLSEAEQSIVAFAESVCGKRRLSDVPGIAVLDDGGREVTTARAPVVVELDTLAMPAWIWVCVRSSSRTTASLRREHERFGSFAKPQEWGYV